MGSGPSVRRALGACGFLGFGALAVPACGGPDFSMPMQGSSAFDDGGGDDGAAPDNYAPPILVGGGRRPDAGTDATAPDGGANDATTGAAVGADARADQSLGDAMTVTRDAAPPSTGSGGDGGSTSVTCVPGGACMPSDCQNGAFACVNGTRTCQATTSLADGTPCGASTAGDAGASSGGSTAAHVCKAGQCVTCNAGADCSDPASPCVKKTFDCSSGSAV
ncbi:MAG: hypothetical protein JOZ69_04295, partial [Myxococcales bacterium]|nr:hypothetical protein [Myxococcales bacterium]